MKLVMLVAGADESLALELAPAARSKDEPVAPSGRGLRTAGWSLFGIGLGVVAGGIPLVVIDERPVKSRCDDPMNIDVNGRCLYRYNTLGSGIGLVAVGAATIVTSAVLLGIGYKRKKKNGRDDKRRAHALPTAGGMILRL